MAVTDFPLNHPQAVKLWSRKIAREALKATHAFQFMGTSQNSLIQVKDDTKKSAGDRVRIPLRMLLSGSGVGEGTSLEGNEEALSFLYDDLVINDLAHAVRNKTTIADQRVPFDTREEASDALASWYADRFDTWFFNQIAGNTGQANTLYTGNQAALAPTSATGNTRIIYPTAHSTENSISASGSYTFDLSFLDRAVNIAKTATPLVRPIKMGNQEYYVAFLHPNSVRSMRTTTSTGQWLDIQKAALQGGDLEESPIFTGALGVYNGVVIHENTRVPLAPSTTTVRRNIFCGAQAAAMAFGKGYGEEPKYVEDDFDYGRELGVSVQTIAGLKKLQFSLSGGVGGGVVDFGTIVMSTYDSAP